MTDARVIRFPLRPGRCPNCGDFHPDPKVKWITWCPNCGATPLYPWTCPNCGAEHRAAFRVIFTWSISMRDDSSPAGTRTGFHYACSKCEGAVNTDERKREDLAGLAQFWSREFEEMEREAFENPPGLLRVEEDPDPELA